LTVTGPSTKDHEHLRRTGKASAPCITVDESKTVSHSQETFLSNESNKEQLIQLLMQRLTNIGHTVQQAAGDADCDIANAALTLANKNKKVVVVADDTDILVLLVYHFSSTIDNIYLSTSGKRKVGEFICIRMVQAKIGIKVSRQVLVIHALGGCDTTSALHGKSKSTAYTKLTDLFAILR